MEEQSGMAYLTSKGFQEDRLQNKNKTIDLVHSKMEPELSDVSSSQYHDEYDKLRSYCRELTLYKHELSPVLDGVFIHCFLDMLANGDVQPAKNFFDKYRLDHGKIQDLDKLEGLQSSNSVEEREFSGSLRHTKVDVEISQCAHELLIQYLDQRGASLMQRIIEKHINFKVSPRRPVSTSENTQVVAYCRKRLASVKNKPWSQEEDEALCKAYMFCVDGSYSTKKVKDGFWDTVNKKFYELYKSTVPPGNRNYEGCHARWRQQILPRLQKWYEASKKAERLNASEESDKEYLAQKIYKEDVKKPFIHHSCWEICKDLAMLQEPATKGRPIRKNLINDLDGKEESSLVSHVVLQPNTRNYKKSKTSVDLKAEPDLSITSCPSPRSVEEPAKYHDGFGKLRSWTLISLDIYKHEFLRVLYPVFIHCFMDMVEKGYRQEAKIFFVSYHKDHESMWLKDLQIFEGLSPSILEESEFARSLRQKKIEVNICQFSYDRLLQYLHNTDSTLMHEIINEYINFKVSPGLPASISNATEVATPNATEVATPTGISQAKDDPPQAQVQDSMPSPLRQEMEGEECEDNNYLKKIASALEIIVKQNDILIEEKRRRYEERKRDRREKMDDYIMALNTKDMTPLSNTYFQGKKRKIMEQRGRILCDNVDSNSPPTTSPENSL